MIGSGAFLLPSALAPFGLASLAGWAVTLCGALLLAATFARLTALWPQSGGPYIYARNAFGEFAGFTVAWSYWVSVWCANAAIAVAFAGSLGALVPATTATPLRGAACALAALWICTLVNLAGVREAGRMQVVTTVLKLVPLLLFGVVAVWSIDPSSLRFNPSGGSFASVTQSTVALTLWALLGLEAATVPAGAVHDAERTVPRATLLGTLLAGIATVLACSTVVALLPGPQLASSSAPMADAARLLWGPTAGIALAAVMAVSCFGALNGWVLVCGQVSLAAARDGVFPSPFARCDARGTPVAGVLIGTLLSSVLVLSNYSHSLVQLFTFSILLSTAATLVPYVASTAAWLRQRGQPGRVLAALALIYALYALVGTGREALAWGAVLILAGMPLYAWRRFAARARPT
ncbi:amino acid permease [Lysobacter sp. TY2-98]|nr:amino acid permease [Lysobacter sp. TY2-98]